MKEEEAGDLEAGAVAAERALSRAIDGTGAATNKLTQVSTRLLGALRGQVLETERQQAIAEAAQQDAMTTVRARDRPEIGPMTRAAARAASPHLARAATDEDVMGVLEAIALRLVPPVVCGRRSRFHAHP